MYVHTSVHVTTNRPCVRCPSRLCECAFQVMVYACINDVSQSDRTTDFQQEFNMVAHGSIYHKILITMSSWDWLRVRWDGLSMLDNVQWNIYECIHIPTYIASRLYIVLLSGIIETFSLFHSSYFHFQFYLIYHIDTALVSTYATATCLHYV